eukprot:CAMPEP_0194373806 /NCGR_PEP_ID=MMETSP0174-20130528/22236_1 /TAXON_ID=216777 /ORGANISM="Proboscia alata, Strain PI-D3" /LENGTH=554 /DNA_ID=CAMNT_0039153071 /DNA_START=411 /DNA_END=2075 /DNA_ORIENTATION=+
MKLKLYVENASKRGGIISRTTTDWNSDDLNFNNAPSSIIQNVLSIGNITKGKNAKVNLPNSFSEGNGELALRIDPENNNLAAYRKSTIKLTIQYEGSPDPNCDLVEPGPSDGSVIPSLPYSLPTSPPPINITNYNQIILKPSATFAQENNANMNYFDMDSIQVDNHSIRKISFLKFYTHCVNGPVHKIELKLPCTNGSDEGGLISTTYSDWHSEYLNWDDAPPALEEISLIGRVGPGPAKSIELPSYILNGNYQSGIEVFSLRIDPRSNDGAKYTKDEIELLVTYDGDISPGCTSPPKPPSSEYFQIKLHWEEGYCWQEICEERRFCVDCMDDCRSLDVKLRECNAGYQKQYWKWNDGKLESKRTSGYCMSYNDTKANRNSLFMTECSEAKQFMGFHLPPDQDKFLWHPLGDDSICTTNPHHPRSNEVIYSGKCEDGLKHDTAYWVTGSGWDGLGGYEFDNIPKTNSTSSPLFEEASDAPNYNVKDTALISTEDNLTLRPSDIYIPEEPPAVANHSPSTLRNVTLSSAIKTPIETLSPIPEPTNSSYTSNSFFV